MFALRCPIESPVLPQLPIKIETAVTFAFKSWFEVYEALAYGFDTTLTIRRPNSS